AALPAVGEQLGLDGLLEYLLLVDTGAHSVASSPRSVLFSSLANARAMRTRLPSPWMNHRVGPCTATGAPAQFARAYIFITKPVGEYRFPSTDHTNGLLRLLTQVTTPRRGSSASQLARAARSGLV